MTRIVSATIAIPVVILLTLFAPAWLFALVIGLVSALAVEEFFSLAEKQGIGRPGRWFLVPAAGVAVSFLWGFGSVLAAIVASAMLLMTAAVFSGTLHAALGRIGMGLGSIVYCPLTLGFMILMPRNQILLLFAIIWVGDTAAYYGGRALGRHLLAPQVSPKKTVEGAISGLAGSMGVGIAAGSAFFHQPVTSLIWIS